MELLKEEAIINSKELRNEMVSRIDILDKVKELLLIPQTDLATVKQVAEFYEVTDKVIEQIYLTHKDELISDGMMLKRYGDFLNLDNLGIKKTQGKSVMILTNETELTIPNRGLRVFPRRAILRIGMLLRDSEVAKNVRTQLLNIEEKTSDETKIQDINEEQKLMLEVGMAFASGNINTLAIASTNLMAFKNRYINEIEKTLEEQKPIIDFAEHLSVSNETIDMLEMSKLLSKNGIKIGRNKLFDFLENNGVLMLDHQPYQKYIDWFDVIESAYDTGYSIKISFKPLITYQGQKGITKMIKKAFSNNKI